MAQNVNMIIDCDYTSCPYNYEHECGKDVIFLDDSDCIAQYEWTHKQGKCLHAERGDKG